MTEPGQDLRWAGPVNECLCGCNEFLAHIRMDQETRTVGWWGLDAECCNPNCNALVRLPYPGDEDDGRLAI
jgi:hypothetical protein